jgi:antitoxin HicB
VSKRYTVSDGELVLFLWPAEEGEYNVTSPLHPELITQAESLEEAFFMARDALELLNAASPPEPRSFPYQAEAQAGDRGTEAPPTQVEDEFLPLTHAQERDLERRLCLYEKNPSRGSSWNEVKVRLEQPRESTHPARSEKTV